MARIDTGQDVFFALDGYTFTRLLRLRIDGTFAEYAREHLFVAIRDGGRWRQSDDGTLLLCSHYGHEPISAGAGLTRQKVMRLNELTWLSDLDDDLEKELIEEYRRHKKGPFLSAVAPVRVDAKIFEQLLGTRQSFMYRTEMNQVIPRQAPLQDLRGKRLDAPRCGVHKELMNR